MLKFTFMFLMCALAIGYPAFAAPTESYYALDAIIASAGFSFELSLAAFTLAMKALFAIFLFLFLASVIVAERRAGLRGNDGSGVDLNLREPNGRLMHLQA